MYRHFEHRAMRKLPLIDYSTNHQGQLLTKALAILPWHLRSGQLQTYSEMMT